MCSVADQDSPPEEEMLEDSLFEGYQIGSGPTAPEIAENQVFRETVIRILGRHFLGVFIGVSNALGMTDGFRELVMDHEVNGVRLAKVLECESIIADHSHVIRPKSWLHGSDSQQAIVSCDHRCRATLAHMVGRTQTHRAHFAFPFR